MKTTFSLLLIVLVGFSASAQNLICVQSGANASFYTDVQDAIDNAQNGDYIYLPGGAFNIGTISIDKGIHLVGAGHFVDSALVTGISFLDGDIQVLTGAHGGSIEGFEISGAIDFGDGTVGSDYVEGFSIIRVLATSIILGSNYPSLASSIVLKECIFTGLAGHTAQNVLITNCIIVGLVNGFDGNAVFENCIFARHADNITLTSMYECVFRNSVFMRSTNWTCSNASNNEFFNNLFCHNSNTISPCNSLEYDNIYGVSLADVFVNVPIEDVYDPTYNFHLKPTCPGVGAGSDGTNVGIYGGSYGAKEGFVPYNPHVQINQIDNQTNGQGNLPVHIQVAAQER